MNKVSAHLIATATTTATALLVLVSPLRAAEITQKIAKLKLRKKELESSARAAAVDL